MESSKQPSKKIIYLTSKNVFITTLLVIALTLLGVWQFGLGNDRTLVENSIWSTSILSLVFFLFVSIGLYNGIKLKDNLGKITNRFDHRSIIDFASVDSAEVDMPDIGEGLGGIIGSILLWLGIGLLFSFLFWFFAAIFWMLVLIFAAMLYWIFFRALRLVFKNSKQCKGQLGKSIKYGLGYTVLYNFWIYALILFQEIFRNGSW